MGTNGTIKNNMKIKQLNKYIQCNDYRKHSLEEISK